MRKRLHAAVAALVLSGTGTAQARPLADALLELAVQPSVAALAQIPDTGRRLLALRSYVRAGSRLPERWSWTEEQIAAFQGSTEQKVLLDEVAAVSARFAQSNPGYAIYANTKVRSLDVQVVNWNRNDSVGAAAEEILAAWTEAFGSATEWPEGMTEEKVRRWLSGFSGHRQSNIAAPGLTPHGQAHAIDFQVMKDGAIIAGADSRQIETVWRAEKWDVRLKDAMTAAGPSFSGPLTSPDEPWHYNYAPPGAAPVPGRRDE